MIKFNISEKDGLKYSKISGDTNKIHIDNLTGYNSIFGEKICHGTLVLIKILEKIDLLKIINDKNLFYINFNFAKYFKYQHPISVIKNKNIFNIYQEDQKKLTINFSLKKKIDFSNFKKKNNIVTFYPKKNKNIFNIYKKKQKKLKINFSLKKKIDFSNFKKKHSIVTFYPKKNKKISDIFIILNNLSKYVGTVYPGRFSIISEINIYFNKHSYLFDNKLKIISKKIDPRLPIIENQLTFKNYLVQFKSLERPIVKNNKKIDNKLLRNKINKIKYNALIIGGSQGIGKDVLNILSDNHNIKKFVTYNKNKISKKSNTIYPIKFNVFDKINTLDKIIEANSPLKIYYFASPKIYFDNTLPLSIKKNYKFIFLNFPSLLLERYKNKNITLFYPSTSNILENRNSYYSKIKKNAEHKIKKICLKYRIPFEIVRFPALNSRQSVSLTNPSPTSLNEYLKKYPKIINKIF